MVTIYQGETLATIDEKDLKVNDRVVVQTGDIVPADMKLETSKGLEVDEFEITGELTPVDKRVGGEDDSLYAGSRVIRGSGTGVVVTRADQTEWGKVLSQADAPAIRPGLDLPRKEHFWPVLVLLPAMAIFLLRSLNPSAVVGAFLLVFVVVIGLQQRGWFSAVLWGMERGNLRRLNIQVVSSRVLEPCAEIDTVCFDKTGVLTTRQLDVQSVHFSDSEWEKANFVDTDNPLFRMVRTGCALCNDVAFLEKMPQADPFDRALTDFAGQNGVDLGRMYADYQRIYEQPFDPENRYMVAGFKDRAGELLFLAKGDPEVILARCSSYLNEDGVVSKISYGFLSKIQKKYDLINRSGGTAIALAYAGRGFEPANPGFTFLCLLQLENRLRPEVPDVISRLSRMGIRSLLLTGDRPETAIKIAQVSGIAQGTICLSGKVIDRMDGSEIARQAAYCPVFARFLPSQKGYLVRLLQQSGKRVGMLGDGSNDAIALRSADVGISFQAESSPIARKSAQILVNQLTDIVGLLEIARRMKAKLARMDTIRKSALVVICVGVYLIAIFTK